MVGIPRLTDLKLSSTHVSQAAIDRLEKEMPRLKVEYGQPLEDSGKRIHVEFDNPNHIAGFQDMICECPKCLASAENEIARLKAEHVGIKIDSSKAEEFMKRSRTRAIKAKQIATTEGMDPRTPVEVPATGWDGHAP